jgi:GTPase KRas protein
LEAERQVTTGEGAELAKSFGCPFMESSAKTRVNVEESFFELVREIKKDNGGDASKKKKSSGKKKGCRIV